MASKSGQSEQSVDIEELLDQVDKTLDRVKVLYEQYFLGMQKQPPSHMHNDVERRLRDLMQISIRNTGLRYRFATLQQKFGSYNTYWRRTLRQIENGTYIRQLSKISRQAALTGEEVPEEILAAMPKRMRDQVKRDREQALAIATRRQQTGDDEFLEEAAPAELELAAPAAPQPAKTREPTKGAHILSDDDFDGDFDSLFAAMEAGDSAAPAKPAPTPAPPRPAPPTGPQAIRAATLGGPPPSAPRSPTASGPPPLRPSAPAIPSSSQTGPQQAIRPPTPPGASQTGPQAALRPSAPAIPNASQTGAQQAIRPPTAPGASQTGPQQAIRPPPTPGASQTGPQPAMRASAPPIPQAGVPRPATPPGPAARTTPPAGVPVRPPSSPGASGSHPAVPGGATPPARPAQPPAAAKRPEPGPPMRPPPGMNEADVNALYSKYVKAKEMVGETAGPGAYSKLMQTINAQAPKIMEQYKAKGVEFSVVVKDNQVVIKAKPKT